MNMKQMVVAAVVLVLAISAFNGSTSAQDELVEVRLKVSGANGLAAFDAVIESTKICIFCFVVAILSFAIVKIGRDIEKIKGNSTPTDYMK